MCDKCSNMTPPKNKTYGEFEGGLRVVVTKTETPEQEYVPEVPYTPAEELVEFKFNTNGYVCKIQRLPAEDEIRFVTELSNSHRGLMYRESLLAFCRAVIDEFKDG